MRKTYLSLQMSRMWSADMPIGDPHGGPANDERAMAFIVVATSAASIAAGAATFSFAAGFTLANIAAGALIVGGTLSIVGKLSGNQKLMKWGSVLQLVGGIGTFTSGAADSFANNGTFGDAMKAGMTKVSDTYAKGWESLGISTSTAPSVSPTAGAATTVVPPSPVVDPASYITPLPPSQVGDPSSYITSPPPPSDGLLGSVKTMAKDAGTWMEANKMATFIGANAIKSGFSYLSAQEAAAIAEQQRQRKGAAPYVVNNAQDAETARAAGVNFIYMPTPTKAKPVATQTTQVAAGPTVAVPTVTAPMPA